MPVVVQEAVPVVAAAADASAAVRSWAVVVVAVVAEVAAVEDGPWEEAVVAVDYAWAAVAVEEEEARSVADAHRLVVEEEDWWEDVVVEVGDRAWPAAVVANHLLGLLL
jgi:hypothetical protein